MRKRKDKKMRALDFVVSVAVGVVGAVLFGAVLIVAVVMSLAGALP